MPGHHAAPPVAQAHRRSLDLLRRNLTAHGIRAATPSPASIARRYDRVFARDASICALAMLASGEPDLVDGAIAGLDALARAQADQGQLPNFITSASGEPADFWYLGCIDASLWWLIAHAWAVAFAPGRVPAHWAAVRLRAIAWLRAQEHPRFGLVQQNEASDWADVMPRSGFVLYSNALWYHVKRLHDVPHPLITRRSANELFHPFGTLPADRRLRVFTHFVRRGGAGHTPAQGRGDARSRRRRDELFLSFVNLASWGDEGDVVGNLLAVLTGLAGDDRAEAIVHALTRERVAEPYPIRAVCAPIDRDHLLWRPYMRRHRQNLDFQYHNGGIWPMAGGLWVMTLAERGKRRAAADALVRLAQVNALGDWRFNEWLHGRTLAPLGMDGQSWNAAAFLLAEASLAGQRFARVARR